MPAYHRTIEYLKVWKFWSEPEVYRMIRKTEIPERREHVNQMAEKYSVEIGDSVKNSHIYGPEMPAHIPGKEKPSVCIVSEDSFSAAESYGKGKTAILNFADYVRRGGLYLYGSNAQEEALCGDSDLWNILNDPAFDEYFAWNKANQKDYLYYDRAIYSPSVVFSGNVRFDVLSCAAPYKSAAGHYKGIPAEEAKKAMNQRIQFVRNVLEQEHVETAVLGAYGCGVFGNSVRFTAECFEHWFCDTSIRNIVYAMPDQRKRQIFEKIMNEA